MNPLKLTCNHDKTKHNKTVCIFYGIFCILITRGSVLYGVMIRGGTFQWDTMPMECCLWLSSSKYESRNVHRHKVPYRGNCRNSCRHQGSIQSSAPEHILLIVMTYLDHAVFRRPLLFQSGHRCLPRILWLLQTVWKHSYKIVPE